MGSPCVFFAVELQKVSTKHDQMYFLQFLREDWGEFQNRYVEKTDFLMISCPSGLRLGLEVG